MLALVMAWYHVVPTAAALALPGYLVLAVLTALALFGRGVAHDLNNVSAVLRGLLYLAGRGAGRLSVDHAVGLR